MRPKLPEVDTTVTDHEPVLPEDHFITLLSLELAIDGGTVSGSAPVRPELFAPGTRRMRTGPLATMVDLVAGHTPNGPYGPTIDMRVQTFARPPSDGRVHLTCRALRVGSRLIVAETLLRPQHAGETPFARALTTFMHVYVGPGLTPGPRPLAPMADASFDALLAPRAIDDHTLVLDPSARIDNGIAGTLQGGVQALLAEIAAARTLGAGRPMVAGDLDIRFLGRMHIGPLQASVEPIPTGDGAARATVALTDAGAGADGKLVSYVTLTMIAADDAS